MLAVAALIVVHVLLAPPPAERVAEAVRAVYADGRVQKELPPPPKEPERTGGGGCCGSSVGSGAAGAAMTAVMWTVLGVLGALVIALIVSAIASRQARERTSEKATVAAATIASPSAAAVPPSVEDAERLATEGRYDEAVHVLLLCAVHGVASAGPTVPLHWTSREVLDGVPLAGSSGGALRLLVDAVEQSRFGGRALRSEGWTEARAAFRGLEAARRAAS